MINPKEIITNLQNKPYQTRIRILWGTMAVVCVILLAVWVFSLKSTIKGLDGKSLINIDESNKSDSQMTNQVKISAERIERTDDSLKIYFNIENPTTDILNFSQTSDVRLTVEDQTYTPKQILDRQNNTFVQKVLSKTTNFGILVFEKMDGDQGKLEIDGLSFENAPDQLLKQDLDLNFTQLDKSSEVRN